MKAINIKKLALYASTAMLVHGDNASAANNVLEPHETYKSKYIFVPGTQGSHGYWGKSAITPQEAWNQDPNVHFQTAAIGSVISTVGSFISSAASTVASAAGSLITSVVSNAGGIAGVVTKVVPFAANLTKDLVMQQMAANNAAAQSNAENKAANARVIVTTEADKAIADRQAETALKLKNIEEKEATKRAQIQAEKEKAIAKIQAGEKKAEPEAGEKKPEAAATEKKPETEASKTAEAEKQKLKEIAKKDEKADKELKTKVNDLVKATDTVKKVVEEKVGSVAVTTSQTADKPTEKPLEKPEEKTADKPAEKAADKPADTTPGKTSTSLPSPNIEIGTKFTAENEEMPSGGGGYASKDGKVGCVKFQKDALSEVKTEKLIGSVAEKIQKESQVFVDALNKLVEARAAGLEAKDLGPQIKAVDASWDKLQKLYAKNEEAAKEYDRQLSEFDQINFDDDAELDLLIGGSGDEPDLDKYTEEQIDQMTDKEIEEELNQLDALLDQVDQLEKQLDQEQAG